MLLLAMFMATDDSRRLAFFLTPLPPSSGLVQGLEVPDQRATHSTPPRRPRARTSPVVSTQNTTRPRRRHFRRQSAGNVAYMTSSNQNVPFESPSSSFIPPHFLDEPGSPPPYSPTPPNPPPLQAESSSSSLFLTRRAASSPHINSPPSSPTFSSHSAEPSRRPSTITLHARRSRQFYDRVETSDDPDTDASLSEDTVIYTSTRMSLAGSLRARLLGKGKARADEVRPISTAPGVIGAGETETEGEDTVSFPCLSCLYSLPHIRCQLMLVVVFGRLPGASREKHDDTL